MWFALSDFILRNVSNEFRKEFWRADRFRPLFSAPLRLGPNVRFGQLLT